MVFAEMIGSRLPPLLLYYYFCSNPPGVTPLYELSRYVRLQRVWLFRVLIINGVCTLALI